MSPVKGSGVAPRGKGTRASKTKAPPKVQIPPSIAVRQLAETLRVDPVDVIKKLMRNGIMANINQVIDYETAAMIATAFGYEVSKFTPTSPLPVAQEMRHAAQDTQEKLKPRAPVITVMGHVDHGKTTLLDAIRETNVAAGEVGSITQHIGAYQVELDGRKITFIDTPGHEAFTTMRARGAQVTDIAVLVVAADDGVMPQTAEAISHARAAGVPIVVAVNKVDKSNANEDRVKKQLADEGLVIEEWGGDIIAVPVSAKNKKGISDLLENILVVAEIQELRADPDNPAIGTVLEATMDKTKGPLATVLVQSGTLRVGDIVIAGNTQGKIKAMFNDKGKQVKKAEPSTPVKILGISEVPQAGDIITVLTGDQDTRAISSRLREQRQRELASSSRPPGLDELHTQLQEGKIKELNIVLKTDVQGSIEPIKNSLEQLTSEKVRTNVIHTDSGSITEGDILLAQASNGIVIGFNTRPTIGAQKLAELHNIDIRTYQVIYEMVEEVRQALLGMLEPVYVEAVEGHAEVRQVFGAGKKTKIAGTQVIDGKASRNALARITRQGEVLHQSTVTSLRRYKDDVKEVAAGIECGVGVDGFADFQIGDVIEFYRKERASGTPHRAD
ncbi:MAG: translation initiation factor IF-2 [Chloroflexota bacterium]|nr:translation initiation factor IF-2 [Chloroflexota bacterium]